MLHRHPIKETVKLIYITKPTEKIRFQIRHPDNVFAITGIAVTCTMPKLKDKRNRGQVAGYLSLAIPERGDVVFGEDVQIDDNNYSDYFENLTFVPNIDKSFSFAGKRRTYFKTLMYVKDAVLEGYYEDVYLPLISSFQLTEFPKAAIASIASREKKQLYYTLKVYIRYLTKFKKLS